MNSEGLYYSASDIKIVEAAFDGLYMMTTKPVFPEPFQHLDSHLDLGLYSDDDIDTLIDFMTDYLRNRRPEK